MFLRVSGVFLLHLSHAPSQILSISTCLEEHVELIVARQKRLAHQRTQRREAEVALQAAGLPVSAAEKPSAKAEAIEEMVVEQAAAPPVDRLMEQPVLSLSFTFCEASALTADQDAADSALLLSPRKAASNHDAVPVAATTSGVSSKKSAKAGGKSAKAVKQPKEPKPAKAGNATEKQPKKPKAAASDKPKKPKKKRGLFAGIDATLDELVELELTAAASTRNRAFD
jgi:hypothetical protein